MLYVSSLGLVSGEYRAVVTDSETGREFKVDKVGLMDWRCGCEPFAMTEVLGYFNNSFFSVVDKRLVGLLEYVDYVEFEEPHHSAVWDVPLNRLGLGAIWVSDRSVSVVSKYNVMFYLGSNEHYTSLVDIILFISRDKRFNSILHDGEFVVQIGNNSTVTRYLSVRLCGDYMGYVMKLVTMYQKEIQSKVDRWGL